MVGRGGLDRELLCAVNRRYFECLGQMLFVANSQPVSVKRSETSLFNGDGRGVQQNLNEVL